jgi:arginine/ornithine N-succinyltransferase beta subunit
MDRLIQERDFLRELMPAAPIFTPFVPPAALAAVIHQLERSPTAVRRARPLVPMLTLVKMVPK